MTIVEPDTDFLIPVQLDSALGLQTGISLTNPTDSPVAIRLRLYDGTGVLFEEKTVSLPSRGEIVRFVGEIFNRAGSPGAFRGVLEIDSPIPMNGAGLQVTGQGLATLPLLRPGEAARNLDFVHFADGREISSNLILVNPSLTETAIGIAEFRDATGQPAPLQFSSLARSSRFVFSIPPRGSRFFLTSGLGDLVTGSIRVTSSHPISGL